jgi:hypothetical protein
MSTKHGLEIRNIIPDDLKESVANVDELVRAFATKFEPAEARDFISIYVDARTQARYAECHVHAATLVPFSTIDVPLDPEQPDYRANREIVTDHMAFRNMKEDAAKRRTFSNIVAEFTTEYEAEHPLKIIGGQHRYEAIREALEAGVDEYHGVKVYFGLTLEQRLDVQLISNTVIAVSSDLYDRMQETARGPELRKWCQDVGLIPKDEDFADRRQRGANLTVRAARTFIINYYRGQRVNSSKFDDTDTTPVLCGSGDDDPEWDKVRKPHIWKDAKLRAAGEEFAKLVEAQRNAFGTSKKGAAGNIDFAEKALNYAVLAAWSFSAGMLHQNDTRLKRHFDLRTQSGRDPLNASVLAKGRHKTDSENYRGLGYRTDAKERGRFVELFHRQAEKGGGINTALVDVAIKRFHAKQANLEPKKAEEKDGQ